MSSVTQLNGFSEPQNHLNNETKMNETYLNISPLKKVSRDCLSSFFNLQQTEQSAHFTVSIPVIQRKANN